MSSATPTVSTSSSPPAWATAEVRMDAGEVYRRLATPVHAYLRGQDAADPDDLLGEVFYRVARSLDGFVGDDDELRRWVFTIARNCVIDDQRRRTRRARHRREQDRPVPSTEAPEQDHDLAAALALLTREQREVIALRFIADLAIEDVARMTNRTVGAVKSMQHRALEQLAHHLRPSGSTGDTDG